MSKFGNIGKYITDEELEISGVDLDFGDGIFITVARAGDSNIGFINQLANSTKNSKTVSGYNGLSKEEEAGILREIFAKHIVLGWRGLKDEHGKEIKYSVQNCIDLFTESPEIFKIVRAESQNIDNYRKQEVTESGNE